MMNLAKKILVPCAMAAIMCVPAYADDDAIDMSLIMYGSATLTVNVDGELSNTLSGTYSPGDVVTITAPEVSGKTFNCWTDSTGVILSCNSELSLVIHADTVLNAVYSTQSATAQPHAGFLSITRTSGQIMFNVLATAPTGTSITEYGIRYSTTKNTLAALKGDDGVTVESADNPSASNWLFGVAASEDTTYYVTAYAVADGTTYYSDMMAVALSNLGEGVSAVVMLANLLMGGNVDLDNISPDIIANLQARLFTVSFDANNGTGAMAPQGFLKDLAAALTPNTFTRTYYTFGGWNTQANGSGTAYADEATVTMSANTRLYAQWKGIPYALTYVLNGATDPGNPKSYTVEDSVTLKVPTKNAYTFTGWTGTGIKSATTTITIPKGSTGARSYTANFKPTVYTITYELDGGTNAPDNPASYDIETPTITLKNPTKEGYDFAGWTMDGFAVTEIPAGSSGDKTITANWGDIAPVLSAAKYSLEAKEGEPTSLTINAAGLNLSWNLDGALPSGLAFSGEGSTASISGTPEAGTAGTYPVKVIAANKGGSASADMMITVASASTGSKDITSRDVKRNEPVTTVADSGASTTRTATTLTDSEGNVLLAAEIAITTEAEEFAAVVGEEFSTRVNVDVSIDIRSTSYDKYAYLMEIFGLPEWLKTDGTLESSGTLEAGQHYEFTLTGTPVASQDAHSVVFAATVMITGDTPEIEAYADKEVMLAVKVEAASGDITPKPGDSDQSPDVTPKPGDSDQSPDVTPKPGDSDQSPDVMPAPVVIENGKITINADDSGESIAEIIANMTDEEKRSITKLEINSEVQSLEWISELKNLKELTLNETASVEELDISGNTAITELNTHGANVKTLNASGCTNLVSLDCSSCGLESINLNGCTSLNTLNISNNSLLMFNAGNLASLQELICDSQVVYMKSTGKIFALGEYFSASSFVSSASGIENVKNLKAFDASGSEIAAELDSVTGTVSCSESPSKMTYDYDTGFSGVMMDVTVYFTDSSTEDSGRVGSSSGGCNSAFGLLTISAGLILILLKRR